MQRRAITRAAIAWCAVAPACGSRAVDPGPALQIVGEATVIRSGDPVPATSPWFDGKVVHLVAARGETLGFQVVHRGGGPVQLALPGVTVRGYDVDRVHVARPSTELYGGSRGAGDYPDGLTLAATPTTDPAYFELDVPRDALAGTVRGTLAGLPVQLDVSSAVLDPARTEAVWAYEDPRELGSTLDAPTPTELACIATFRRYGVLLSPDLPISSWPARRALLAGAPDVPVRVDARDPSADVRAWTDALRGSDQRAFAIPIDEPRDAAARARVVALADAVHAAGSGVRYAVTAAPSDDLRGHVDLFISPATGAQWTYNGKPPSAAAMVVDAPEPGLRTWGWIAYRYAIPTWYVWDALYWHDRYHKKTALAPARDAVSFDDGGDVGNLDGVLALPGCRPTLRLAALHRGLQDHALLDTAARCDPAATKVIAERMIPRALGEAHGDAAWPASDAAFEAARRELILIAAACTNGLPR
jgi:hypothetical protein